MNELECRSSGTKHKRENIQNCVMHNAAKALASCPDTTLSMSVVTACFPNGSINRTIKTLTGSCLCLLFGCQGNTRPGAGNSHQDPEGYLFFFVVVVFWRVQQQDTETGCRHCAPLRTNCLTESSLLDESAAEWTYYSHA